jgi:hypothetical protein
MWHQVQQGRQRVLVDAHACGSHVGQRAVVASRSLAAQVSRRLALLLHGLPQRGRRGVPAGEQPLSIPHIVASDAMHAGDEQRVWPGRVQAVRLLALPSLYFCNTQAGTCCLWSIGTRTRRRDAAHCAVEIWRLVYVFVCANMG